MILDILDNADRYVELNTRFQAAMNFLRRSDLGELPTGRMEIDGNGLYAVVIKGPGRSPMDALIETHDRYIDIQYLISGDETIGWKARRDLGEPTDATDPRNDVTFYPDKPVSWTALTPGMMGIYFPEDAHMPMLTGGEVHKVVVKVALD
jgi:YhcH/YjgK/YiaL family protein